MSADDQCVNGLILPLKHSKRSSHSFTRAPFLCLSAFYPTFTHSHTPMDETRGYPCPRIFGEQPGIEPATSRLADDLFWWKKPTFTVILPQSPTVHTRVQPGGLWGLLCRNWMRNDYCDKFSTSGLQNHYVPGSPTFNHNSHFGKDSKKLCCESEESNAISYTEPWGQERRQRTRERCDCNAALR